MPKGSVLRSDLHVAIEKCKICHFANDTHLLVFNKSLKRLDKLWIIDLKSLTNWFNANKMLLNVSKTELFIFKPKRKLLNFNMKIKLNGKIYLTDSMKYLGVKINSKLIWKSHVNTIAIKLDWTNFMLYKVTDIVSANIQSESVQAIMHYLNHTLIRLPSYGDKTIAQLTISTSLELSILKSIILTSLLCFISLKYQNWR